MQDLLNDMRPKTNAVVYLMRKRGHRINCYHDDFVGVPATKQAAQEAYNDFNSLTATLGLDLFPSKCVPLTKSLKYWIPHLS